jgi:hypothetical protein
MAISLSYSEGGFTMTWIRDAVYHGRACRAAVFVLLLWTTAAPVAQQQPASVTNLAAGVEALKSGDLDTAEQVFSDALKHGLKSPLVFHNLGVIVAAGNHTLAVSRFRQAIACAAVCPVAVASGVSLLALEQADAIAELNARLFDAKGTPSPSAVGKGFPASEN